MSELSAQSHRHQVVPFDVRPGPSAEATPGADTPITGSTAADGGTGPVIGLPSQTRIPANCQWFPSGRSGTRARMGP